MSAEKRETIRVCPVKAWREDQRIASHSTGVAALGPPILLGEAPVRKSDEELSCPSECPGVIIKERRLLGIIPLPDGKECPMEPDASTGVFS